MIIEIPEVEYTFIDFFTSIIRQKIPGLSPHTYKLLSSNVGPQKDSLDPVDSALLIQPVISSFGRFLKYCVCVNGKLKVRQCLSHVSEQSMLLMFQWTPPDKCIFRSINHLTPVYSQSQKGIERTNYTMTSKGLKFNADEVDTSGTSLFGCCARYFGTLMAIVMFSCYTCYQYQKNWIVYQKEIILMY